MGLLILGLVTPKKNQECSIPPGPVAPVKSVYFSNCLRKRCLSLLCPPERMSLLIQLNHLVHVVSCIEIVDVSSEHDVQGSIECSQRNRIAPMKFTKHLE